jgi:small subunit ribosomal protein S8
MLTRIRNAQAMGKASVEMPASKVKLNIAELLKAEGYIEDVVALEQSPGKRSMSVKLKYHLGRPVIEKLERISTPGLRRYRGSDSLPKVLGGLGIAIVSTSKGLMTDAKARAAGLGGEVICLVA